MTIRGILCDFDGVLSDSGQDTFKSWDFALKKYNLSMTQEEFFLEEGRSSEEILKNLLKKLAQPETLTATILKTKNDHYKQFGQYSFYPGAKELLTWGRKHNLRLSIVSGGSKDRLLNEKNKPITSLVDLVITAGDVTARKPNPEPYLKAAQLLGLSAEEIIVIENAPLGITAAKAAKMRCLAISSTLPAKYLSEADNVVDNLFEAIKELEIWHKLSQEVST